MLWYYIQLNYFMPKYGAQWIDHLCAWYYIQLNYEMNQKTYTHSNLNDSIFVQLAWNHVGLSIQISS
jgi:hypothetical protein